MNKPDPMAENDKKINAILAMYANWLQNTGGSDRFRMDDQEVLAAINAYTTNKIIERLEMIKATDITRWVTNPSGMAGISFNVIDEHIEALNHRKER